MHKLPFRPLTCWHGGVSCFADGDENGEEGPGEEQQGPQKPKKVLTLTIMFLNLTMKTWTLSCLSSLESKANLDKFIMQNSN